MGNVSNFTIGQIINFDYDLPVGYQCKNRGRKNGSFEVVAICDNPVLKDAELLIYMKPLDEHFREEYPTLKEFWQHEDLLIKRIEESK